MRTEMKKVVQGLEEAMTGKVDVRYKDLGERECVWVLDQILVMGTKKQAELKTCIVPLDTLETY